MLFELRANLYHFTHCRNVSSIVHHGLCINSGDRGLTQRRRYHRRFGCQPLFLTNDPAYVLDRMMPSNVLDYQLLRVTKHLLVAAEVSFYYNSPYLTNENKTFVCMDNIEPEFIEQVTSWKFLYSQSAGLHAASGCFEPC